MCPCRKALYNIGKKSVEYYSEELQFYKPTVDIHDSELGGQREVIRAAYRSADYHLKLLDKMLPKAAKLHENALYEMILTAQTEYVTFAKLLRDATAPCRDALAKGIVVV